MVAAFLSIFLSAWAPAHATPDSWTSRAPIPAALANGCYIAMAGSDTLFAGPGGTNTFFRYNVSADTWVARANTPAAINTGAALAWTGGNFLYLTQGGGTTLYRYSISADTWTTLASAPASLGTGGDLAYPSGAGDFLYATRGFSGGGTNDFYRYRISTDTWTAMTSTPTSVANHGALSNGGSDTLFLLPGNNGGVFVRYRISSNTWDTVATYLGQAQGGTDLDFMPNVGFLYSIMANSGSSMFSYKIATDTWATRTSVPVSINGIGRRMTSSGADSFIYVLGNNATMNFFRYEIHSETVAGAYNGPTWYVNDATYNANDSFSTAAGSDAGDGSRAAPFLRVDSALRSANLGDTVYIDAGTFAQTETLTIRDSGLFVIGVDSTRTVVDFGSTSFPSNRCLAANGLKNLTVKNLRLTNGHRGIQWDFVETGLVEGVQVDTFQHGYHLTSCTTVILRNNRASNLTGQGFRLLSSTANSIINNICEENVGRGINLNGSSSNLVRGNTVRNLTASGIALEASSANNQVIGNLSRNIGSGGAGFFVTSSNNNRVEQNTADSPSGYCFTIGGTSSGNTFRKNVLQPAAARPDSGIQNQTANVVDFARNWWGTVDSAVISIRAVNSGGSTITYIPFRLGLADTAAGADTVAPRAPDTVSTSSSSDTAIRVTWAAVTTSEEAEAAVGLAGYNVYRSLTADTTLWVKIADVAAGTQYIDSGLTNVTRFYRVTARDAHTYVNESFLSDSIASAVPLQNPSVAIRLSNPLDTTSARFTLRVAIDTGTAGDSVRLVINGAIVDTKAIVAAAETVTFSCTLTAQANSVAARYIRSADGLVFADTITIRVDTARVDAILASPHDTTAATFTLKVAIDSGIIGDSVKLVVNGIIRDTRTLSTSAETLTMTCTLTAQTNTVVARYFRSIDGAVSSETVTIRVDTGSVRLRLSNPHDTAVSRFTVRVAIDSGIIGDSVRLVVNGTINETKVLTANAETVTLSCTLTAQANTVAAHYIRSVDGVVSADTITIRIDTASVAIRLSNPYDTTSVSFTIRVAVDSGIVGDSVRLVVNGTINDTKTLSASAETVTMSCTMTATTNTVIARYIRSVDGVVSSDTITIRLGPTSLTLVDSAMFLFSPAAFAADSGKVRVRDALGNNLTGETVTYTVVARPTGATGELIDSKVSDAAGISRVNLKAGDKTGVYVVKAANGSLTPVYFSFATSEYDLPASTWRLIALDRTPANGAVVNAFTGLGTPTNIFHWNPSATDHPVNRQYEVPTTLEPAQGYWIRHTAAARISVSGTSLISDTRDVALKTGWNQVGGPHWYTTRWQSAQIVTSGGSVISAAQAETSGLIQNRIFWYKDNAYQNGPSATNADPVLAPWGGFWVKALANVTLRFSPNFYYSETTTAPLVSAQGLGTTENWRIRLTASGGGGAAVVNFLGVSSAATNGADFALDVEQPPVVSGQFATGLGAGSAFAEELKAPFTAAQVWDFTVQSSALETTVTIALGELGNLPDGFVVMLEDRLVGVQQFSTAATAYAFAVSGGSARAFRVYAGTEAAVRALAAPALSPSATFAYPNPGPAGDGKVRFKYNAVAGGILTLKVFDLGGRKAIERSIDLNSFPAEYAWDCRNDRGNAVATGVYVYILEYSLGSETRRIVDKMAIVR